MNRSILLVIFFFFFFLVIIGCENEKKIGLDLIPEEDFINSFIIDTFTINVYTDGYTNVRTNLSPYGFIGSYIDPVFGHTKAEFIAEVRTDGYFPYISDNFEYTSEKLTLFLDLIDSVDFRSYGNGTDDIQICVYRISRNLTSIYSDTVYYSDENIDNFIKEPYDDSLLASIQYKVTNLADTAIVIPLDESLGQTFLDSFSVYLETTTGFVTSFKGIYVKTNDKYVNGRIFPVDFYSGNSKIQFIYTKESTDTLIRDTFYFPINLNCSRFNLFKHDYENTAVYQHLSDENTFLDSVAYLQSLAGTRVKIEFPYIKELGNLGDIVINKAELVVKTQLNTFPDNLRPVDELTLVGYLPESDTLVAFIDYGYFNTIDYFQSNYYSAYYDYDNNEYRFNVTSFIEDLIKLEELDFDFYLIDKNSVFQITSPRRSVLTTGINSNPMKLVVTYTLIQ